MSQLDPTTVSPPASDDPNEPGSLMQTDMIGAPTSLPRRHLLAISTSALAAQDWQPGPMKSWLRLLR